MANKKSTGRSNQKPLTPEQKKAKKAQKNAKTQALKGRPPIVVPKKGKK